MIIQNIFTKLHIFYIFSHILFKKSIVFYILYIIYKMNRVVGGRPVRGLPEGYIAGAKPKSRMVRKHKGGAWWDFLDPNKNGLSASVQRSNSAIANEFTNPNSNLANFGKKVGNEFTDPNSVLRKDVLPIAGDVASILAMAVPGVGPELSLGIKAVQMANRANKVAGLLGVGKRKYNNPFKGGKMPSMKQMQNMAQLAQLGYSLKNKVSGGRPVRGLPEGYIAGAKPKSKKMNKNKMMGGAWYNNFNDLSNLYKSLPTMGQVEQGVNDAYKIYKIAQSFRTGHDKNPLSSKGGMRPNNNSSANWAYGGAKKKDGRSIRATIVRKVMQERGCSLPMASKIVKQEGLY